MFQEDHHFQSTLPYNHFHFPVVVKGGERSCRAMTEPKRKEDINKAKLEPWDYEPCEDPIGVTHWLPPKRCKNCED